MTDAYDPKLGDRAYGPRAVVGLRPWLLWPLSRSRWWTEPVPAERLALLRIGLALVLLLDILLTYLPHGRDFFGAGSLGARGVFDWMYLTDAGERHWRWSALYGIEDGRVITAALWLWAAATLCLLIGLGTRGAALLVWVLSTSFCNLNSYIDNAGDQVRYIITLYLVLCPCGAAWSVDAWLRRRLGRSRGPVYISPWALRLLFVQMVLMYFFNGLYKASGEDWHSGCSLYYVLADMTLTRWSYAQFPMPYALTVGLSWLVLGWELAFPLLVAQNNRLDRMSRGWAEAALLALVQLAAVVACLGLLARWGKEWSPPPRRLLAGALLFGLLLYAAVTLLLRRRHRLGFARTQAALAGLCLLVAAAGCLSAAIYWGLDLSEKWPVVAGSTVCTAGLGYLAVGVLYGMRRLVALSLLFGVCFHVGIGVSMELGPFVPYVLCLYLPLLPAERLSKVLIMSKEREREKPLAAAPG